MSLTNCSVGRPRCKFPSSFASQKLGHHITQCQSNPLMLTGPIDCTYKEGSTISSLGLKPQLVKAWACNRWWMLQTLYLQVLLCKGANATSKFVCMVKVISIIPWNIKLNIGCGAVQPWLTNTHNVNDPRWCDVTDLNRTVYPVRAGDEYHYFVLR